MTKQKEGKQTKLPDPERIPEPEHRITASAYCYPQKGGLKNTQYVDVEDGAEAEAEAEAQRLEPNGADKENGRHSGHFLVTESPTERGHG